MNRLLKILCVLIFFCGCQKRVGPYELTSVTALLEDRAALALLKAERYEDALETYTNMLEKEPLKPQIHSNIGVVMAQIKKPEDALKSLEHALNLAEQQKDAPALFAIHFNLGVYFGEQKKIDEALQHYQAALDVLPTSKETKTNIELLIQSQNKNGKGEGDKKDQDQKDEKGDQSKDQNGDQDQKDKKDQKPQDDKKDGKDKDKDQEKDKDKDDQKDKPKPDEKGSPKYKPRPYAGDQLSEGDVKKILGELRNQEQKIRANFDKKERKESDHEKDW